MKLQNLKAEMELMKKTELNLVQVNPNLIDFLSW